MAYGLIGGSKSRYAPGAIRSQPMLPVSYSEDERRQIEELQQRPLQFRKEPTPQTSTQTSPATQYPQKMGGLIGAAAPRQRGGRNLSLIGATMQDVAAGLRGGVGNSVGNYLDHSGQVIKQDKMLAQIEGMGISDPNELAFARANPQEYLATRFDDVRENKRYERGRGDQLEDATRTRGWQVEDRDLGYVREDERNEVLDARDERDFARGAFESDRDHGLAASKFAFDQAEAAADGGRDFSDENQIRNQYLGQAKPFVEVRNAYSRIGAAQDNAAGDLSLIFNYMKMLDPGSTVREGEFANAQNATGVPARIINAYNNAMRGERLNPEQRSQFKNQAKDLYNTAAEDYGRTLQFYQGQAGQFGMPGEIFEDFRIPSRVPEVGADGATIYTRRDPRVPDPTQRTGQQTGQYSFADIESEIEAALGEDDDIGDPIDVGRPRLQNDDGTFSTEETITVQRNGKWYNVPTIINGQRYDPAEVQAAFEGGQDIPTVGEFPTLQQAERAARNRTSRIGQVRGQDEDDVSDLLDIY